MNCKPGDMAVIVSASGWGTAGEISQKLIGKIVRVSHLGAPSSAFTCTVEVVWRFTEPCKVHHKGRDYIVNGIADYCLRPIRPHGDDEEDQRFAPKPEEVPA